MGGGNENGEGREKKIERGREQKWEGKREQEWRQRWKEWGREDNSQHSFA